MNLKSLPFKISLTCLTCFDGGQENGYIFKDNSIRDMVEMLGEALE